MKICQLIQYADNNNHTFHINTASEDIVALQGIYRPDHGTIHVQYARQYKKHIHEIEEEFTNMADFFAYLSQYFPNMPYMLSIEIQYSIFIPHGIILQISSDDPNTLHILPTTTTISYNNRMRLRPITIPIPHNTNPRTPLSTIRHYFLSAITPWRDKKFSQYNGIIYYFGTYMSYRRVGTTQSLEINYRREYPHKPAIIQLYYRCIGTDEHIQKLNFPHHPYNKRINVRRFIQRIQAMIQKTPPRNNTSMHQHIQNQRARMQEIYNSYREIRDVIDLLHAHHRHQYITGNTPFIHIENPQP